jgi:hypothetical protein
MGHSFSSAVVGAGLTGAVYVAGMILLRRSLVLDVMALMRRSTTSLTA